MSELHLVLQKNNYYYFLSHPGNEKSCITTLSTMFSILGFLSCTPILLFYSKNKLNYLCIDGQVTFSKVSQHSCYSSQCDYVSRKVQCLKLRGDKKINCFISSADDSPDHLGWWFAFFVTILHCSPVIQFVAHNRL